MPAESNSLQQNFSKNGSYSDYDKFAWLFDQEWGSFGVELFPTLDQLTRGRIPGKAKILDLCCGTGRLAELLSQRGFRVTGLDGSPEMIRMAKSRAPGVEFLCQDARSFHLPPVFDGVFCTFDSLNHLLSSAELKMVFQNVWDCLAKGGTFLFDLNTEEAYLKEWKGYVDVVEKPDYFYVNRAYYDAKTRLAQTHCIFFCRNGSDWERSEARLNQKYHPVEKVKSLLQDVGFGNIRKYALDRRPELHRYSKMARRVLFDCQKL
jgi:SAM-dependent methyltransferase